MKNALYCAGNLTSIGEYIADKSAQQARVLDGIMEIVRGRT